ncbi:patatin-like phospholipase family protein [Bacillus gobiensis]|uniref:patatin-like phospholipase family protein n=1 Tax=Bacillus gobiensis TaxID=1441095 RepID=UPI003D259CF9
MKYPFKNLIFEGGGVKGLAYVGALEVLEEKKILENIERFGGTSAGAITALLLGLGYKLDEIRIEMESVDFQKFKDDSWGEIRDTTRLFFNGFGRYKGNKFRSWLEKRICKKTDGRSQITFAELKKLTGKEVFFQGTNVSTHRIETFSLEYTPNMPVIDAVRISMSIPFFFDSVEWEGSYYVDGGMLDNFPIRLFDWKRFVENTDNSYVPEYYGNANKFINELFENIEFRPLIKDERVVNKETLGLRLDSKAEIDAAKNDVPPKVSTIEDILDFTWNLVGTIMSYQYNVHLNENDAIRTIYIDSVDVSPIDFNLDRKKKDKLITSGKACAEKYIEDYNNS